MCIIVIFLSYLLPVGSFFMSKIKGDKMNFLSEKLTPQTIKEVASTDTSIGSLDILSLVQNSNKYALFPGFLDVHVHLREPGFSYKETIKSGTMAAAAGGYTDVCSMPNLNPVPDSLEALNKQLEIINRDAQIGVHPFGSITKCQNGEALSDMDDLAPFVAGFSDDGKGVQSKDMMLSAMEKAKGLDKIIVAHCEENSLLFGGVIHDGEFAKANNLPGICSKSEWLPIERDIELLKKSGCKYHVCHISTKESVELIRKAKADGVDITCETGPHYLILNDSMLKDEGRFKMNPPIRSEEDRLALIEGIKDGTIDMIATDHAPHSLEEKSKGLLKSAMGVVGLETAFPLLYTELVKTGIITLEKLVDLLCYNPRKRFGIENSDNSFSIWDLEAEYKVNPDNFKTMGRSTPFKDRTVNGKCLLTVYNGKIIFKDI